MEERRGERREKGGGREGDREGGISRHLQHKTSLSLFLILPIVSQENEGALVSVFNSLIIIMFAVRMLTAMKEMFDLERVLASSLSHI